MAKILLIEDDVELTCSVERWLSDEHYTVEVANSGKEGLALIMGSSFDVIVLDWHMPDISGLEILKEYRKEQGATPIIMLTGKTSVAEKETCFDAGADDYLTKPFSMKELSARLRALLRRPHAIISSILQTGDIQLDSTNRVVTKAGERKHLHPIDFALLEFFMRHPQCTFSAEALLQRVWHSDKDVTSDSLRCSIRRIRKALDAPTGDSLIENIPRVGYRLTATVE